MRAVISFNVNETIIFRTRQPNIQHFSVVVFISVAQLNCLPKHLKAIILLHQMGKIDQLFRRHSYQLGPAGLLADAPFTEGCSSIGGVFGFRAVQRTCRANCMNPTTFSPVNFFSVHLMAGVIERL